VRSGVNDVSKTRPGVSIRQKGYLVSKGVWGWVHTRDGVSKDENGAGVSKGGYGMSKGVRRWVHMHGGVTKGVCGVVGCRKRGVGCAHAW